MTPDVEFLVRQSLAVRSVADTYALLSRSLFEPPSRRSIERISVTMNRLRTAPEQPPLLGDMASRHASDAMACDNLLRRQLETRQVPSWPALAAHWQRHGAPACAEALAA